MPLLRKFLKRVASIWFLSETIRALPGALRFIVIITIIAFRKRVWKIGL